MRFKLSSTVLLVAVALYSAACASAPPAAPAPVATVASVATSVAETKSDLALANTSWQLETMWPPEVATPVVPGTDVTLGFGVDRYTGFAGCDWYMGMYSVDTSTLWLQQPAKTIGGCVNKPEGADQQATFLSMLTNSTRYEIKGGNLVFYSSDAQQLMSMRRLEPVPFESATWQALFYFSTNGGVWNPALPGATVTARFDGKTLSGNAGCNDYSATYTRNGNLIQLGPITATKKTCSTPEGVMEQEQGYLRLLDSARIIQQYPRSVELLTAENLPLLAYHVE